MEYTKAKSIADRIVEELKPHCERIEIAGSIRRKKPEVKDIEIVAIPKPYEIGLFETGIATVINKWQKVKGELPCKYTQRILQDGIKVDIFFAVPENWGLIYAIRTGSADYSFKVLAAGWVAQGYKSIDGHLFHLSNNKRYDVREEKDLFARAGVKYCEPEERNL